LICFFIGVCVGLFKPTSYFWAFMTIGMIGYLVESMAGDVKSDLEKELSWMSEAMMDNSTLEEIKHQRVVYKFIQNLIYDKKIKRGMSVYEFRQMLKEYENAVLIDDKLNSTIKWLINKEDNLPNRLSFNGYGYGIPTPKLVLKIKGGKLIGWKSDQVWG